MINQIGYPYPRIVIDGTAYFRVYFTPLNDGTFSTFERPSCDLVHLDSVLMNQLLTAAYNRGVSDGHFQCKQKFNKVFDI
jgi:hypothetical protein